MGGGFFGPGGPALARCIVALCGKKRPRVCIVPTATGDSDALALALFEAYAPLGVDLSCVRFFQRTRRDLRAFVLGQDVVHVSGGNTKSMLAVWRDYGFDAILREAYQEGIVLCGSSAGSICWFEEGVTDSYADYLEPLKCLGFVEGSNCPHYDSEPERRPTFQRLVRERKIAAGVAADDGVGLHYTNGKLARAVSALSTAGAYRVCLTDGSVHEEALAVSRLES
ncbi:MAG: Type 1 glutamine amidotransferase-like domain-containing protein [Candidatus Eremiobacteraeota bacterium]|nr:Type 1 glutamine amidotransferase-like domain-containing protein [Candidatus Eremiobacteraeota bacterium]